MEVQIFNHFDDPQLKDAWQRIWNENEYFVQNSYAWCHIWWRYFANKSRQIYIIAVLDKNRILGIAPFFIERKVFFRQLKFIGHGLTDFHQFIIDDNSYSVIYEQIIHHILSFKSWDIVNLDQINDEDKVFHYLENEKALDKKYRVGCPILDIENDSWEEYFNNICSKNLRKDYRKVLRKFKEKAELNLIRIENADGLSKYLDDIFNLHVERWLHQDEDSKLDQSILREFLKESLQHLTESGDVKTYILTDQDKLVAYKIGFDQGKTYYFWNTSFNHDYYDYSPGKIITGQIIKDLIGRGYTQCHYMRGNYKYKTRWMPKNRKHISNNYLFIGSKHNIQGWLLKNYYLSWKEAFKEKFSNVIENKYFRKLFKLNTQ